jgi:hypothetical protein
VAGCGDGFFQSERRGNGVETLAVFCGQGECVHTRTRSGALTGRRTATRVRAQGMKAGASVAGRPASPAARLGCARRTRQRTTDIRVCGAGRQTCESLAKKTRLSVFPFHDGRSPPTRCGRRFDQSNRATRPCLRPWRKGCRSWGGGRGAREALDACCFSRGRPSNLSTSTIPSIHPLSLFTSPRRLRHRRGLHDGRHLCGRELHRAAETHRRAGGAWRRGVPPASPAAARAAGAAAEREWGWEWRRAGRQGSPAQVRERAPRVRVCAERVWSCT